VNVVKKERLVLLSFQEQLRERRL